jgi:release factor glutamine methyltransferase
VAANDTIREVVLAVAERLKAAGIEESRLEAELLASAVLGVTRSVLRLDPDRPVSAGAARAFVPLLERRVHHEPLQYILGEAAFRELVLHVDRRVLIPRPETEQLVGAVLAWWSGRGRGGAALDVGTGSGAIALSLAGESDLCPIVATDVSADALAVAGANAMRLGLTDRVELREGSLLAPLRPDERFAVIVSNPPYIAPAQRDTLAPEVRDWEPGEALFAGDHGFAVLYALVDAALPWLEPGGLLAVEVGAAQARAVRRRAEGAGYVHVRLLPDLAGHERFVFAERDDRGRGSERNET